MRATPVLPDRQSFAIGKDTPLERVEYAAGEIVVTKERRHRG
jgi:hypothetical protein